MTERGRGSVLRSPTSLSIGPSSLSWNEGKLAIEIDEWTVPFPRRLRGKITVDTGPIFAETHVLDDNSRHHWRPIAPCATARVSFEKPGLAWTGAAYVDMNFGSEALEQGFRSWTWSRQNTIDATRILYDVEQRNGVERSLSFQYSVQGALERFEAPPKWQLPGTGWRVSRATRASPEKPVRILRTLEDTPFYSRSILGSSAGSDNAWSIHESVDLDRFRSRWVQTLLPFKMPRRPR